MRVTPAVPTVLLPQRGGQPEDLLRSQGRNRAPHLDRVVMGADQAVAGKQREVEGPGKGPAPPGGGGEAEQVGDRGGADRCRPVPAHVAVVMRITQPGNRVVPQFWRHQRPPMNRRAEGCHSARGWRGVRRDGRTVIVPDRLGRCGAHAVLISDKNK